MRDASRVGDAGEAASRPTRGIVFSDVARAADKLLRRGDRPTIERVRAELGRGSPTTINPMLDTWWKAIGKRLDSGPAALHRLPESVAHVAEALWVQALEEGRRRAILEQSREQQVNDHAKAETEIRSHVLALRESELGERLKERESAIERLETQVRALMTLLRKEQASGAQSRARIEELQAELLRSRGRLRVGVAPAGRGRTRAKAKPSKRKLSKAKNRLRVRQKGKKRSARGRR